MSTRSGTTRVARWSAQHPWRAVLIWVLFVGAAVSVGGVFSTVQTSEVDYRQGESGKAAQVIADAGLSQAPTENILITATDGQLDGGRAMSAAREVQQGMRGLDIVQKVSPPTWSSDHDALLMSVQLPHSEADLDVKRLQQVTNSVDGDYPGLDVAESGDASISAGVNEQVAADLAAAESLSLPVTFLIMLLAFGALIAAGIPLVLAMSAVLATISLYAPISHVVPSESSVSNMILLIGMAVGVDYSLFYLKRAREERQRGRGPLNAVEVAAATSGHSIVVSGCAVIVAMAGLYVAEDATFNSLATGAIVVVAVAVIGSLTVLPALLSTLGRWVDRPRVPLLWRVNRRIGRGGIARRIISVVVRRPTVSLLLSALVMATLAAPALNMNMHKSSLRTLPSSIPQVQTMQRIQDEFPSQGSSLKVVVRTDGNQRDVVPALRALSQRARHNPEFDPAQRLAIATSDDGTVTMLTLATSSVAGTDGAAEPLRLVRDVWGPTYLGDLHGDWFVGGEIAEDYDRTQHHADRLPWVIGFVLLLTLLMMGLTFKSVPIAVVTTVLNLASVGAAFGVLQLVFGHSWFDALLNYHSSGIVIDWIPLFMFVVLVGLSMDYHVFVLSRVREQVARGLPPRLAVEAGLAETAGVVTSAAAVMVSVFAIFAPLSILGMKQIGVGLAVAVLLDATVVRVVMLPSILTVLGHWAWWPMRPSRPEATLVAVDAPDVDRTR